MKSLSLSTKLVLIFFLSLLVRLAFVPHPGFKADIAYWKWWGKVAVEDGLPKIYDHTNYPPVYTYVMQATSWVYRLFAPLDGSYWSDTNFLYLLLIKLPYIAADLGIGWLIYKLTKSPLAASLFLFNPAAIYNGAIWGQTDSISGFLILLMFYFLLSGRYLSYAISVALNLFLKVQSLPFVFLSAVFLLKKDGLSKTFKTFIPSVATAFVINLPFIAAGNFAAPISTMINSLGYFPYASLNAYNFHWLLIKGVSDRYLDSTLIAGFVSHKTLGLVLFAIPIIALVSHLWKHVSPKALYLVSLLVMFSSFLFMTEIHERYFFPIYMFAALLVALKSIKVPIYAVLAVSGLINLHLVMIQNYPENNLSFLKFLETSRIPISLVLSVINLGLFVYLFIPVFRSLSRKVKLLSLSPLLLLLPSLPRPTPSSVSLTSLKPSSHTQGWGQLKTNQSVDGNLLAPAYYFHRTGLGTHAPSQITYKLDKKFSRFSTGFGVDIESNDAGSAIFALAVDNQVVFRSDVFRKWTPPGFIEVPVTGADNLTLIVTDAGDGQNGDHADWLEPTLYKK